MAVDLLLVLDSILSDITFIEVAESCDIDSCNGRLVSSVVEVGPDDIAIAIALCDDETNGPRAFLRRRCQQSDCDSTDILVDFEDKIGW